VKATEQDRYQNIAGSDSLSLFMSSSENDITIHAAKLRVERNSIFSQI
jgi:hypothetical protein